MEITTCKKNNKLIMRVDNITKEEIHMIELVANGRSYYVKLLENKSESASDALLDDNVGCEDLLVNLNDIKELFVMLTDDQRNIVMHVYYLYKNKKNLKPNDLGEESEDNPKIILQGPAGAGKSMVINLIEKLITWEENKTSDTKQKLKVLKCAFTGKAASNIEGVTLNHVLSIPIYRTRNLNKKRLDTKKELLENCIFFICDEISMVGERLMASVNMRLQQIFENDKLYGNRFVLLVGDLYQIDPVKQKPVYPKSELWTCCEFYELNKIIRQQDEKLINALNNFRDSQMTQDDIDLLRSREIKQIDEVPDCVIHIFYRNNHVDEYNIVKINKSDEKEETVNTIEDSDDWTPYNLRVKLGLRYMITRNMDVGDGLANGTTGIVRGFDYDLNGSVVVIWMEFHSSAIGKRTRSDYFKKHSKPGFEEWVPVYRSNIIVKLKTNPKVSRTIGNMFPLKAAEAVTVHKSQGQTYHEGVCIHLTDDPYDKLRTDKSLQYVALTRVKRLEDLYIRGNFNFAIENSKKFIRTEHELNRLRTERQLKLAFETFEDKSKDVIIFLNTGLTFNEHHQFITTDKWYGNGSLLIFTEITNTSDKIDVPNFEIAFHSDDDTALRSGVGIICYKEPSKSVELIVYLTDEERKSKLTLLKYEKYLYIITGVKGKLSDADFKSAIYKFIAQYIKEERCLFFIGDFNIDGMTSSLAEFFDGLQFKKAMLCNISESASDVLFTRNFDIQQSSIGFYEYIPSSHKPIYVKLPPKSDLFNSQGGTSLVVNEKTFKFQQFGAEEMMELE